MGYRKLFAVVLWIVLCISAFSGIQVVDVEYLGFPSVRVHTIISNSVTDITQLRLYENNQEVAIGYYEIKELIGTGTAVDLIFVVDNSLYMKKGDWVAQLLNPLKGFLPVILGENSSVRVAILGFAETINKTSGSSTDLLDAFSNDIFFLLRYAESIVRYHGNGPSRLDLILKDLSDTLIFRENAQKVVFWISNEAPPDTLLDMDVYYESVQKLVDKKVRFYFYYDFTRLSFFRGLYDYIASQTGGYVFSIESLDFFTPFRWNVEVGQKDLWLWYESALNPADRALHTIELKYAATEEMAELRFQFPEEWSLLRFQTITATPLSVKKGEVVKITPTFFPFLDAVEVDYTIPEGFEIVYESAFPPTLVLRATPNTAGFYPIGVEIAYGEQKVIGEVMVQVTEGIE